MWNRDEEWEIQKTYHGCARLLVTIRGDENRTRQLAALRRCVPTLRHLSPAKVLNRINSAGEIDLGEMAGRDSYHLAEELKAEGLEVKQLDTSYISFIPFNRTNGVAWLIEDPEEAERIVEDMISEGVPIVQIKA